MKWKLWISLILSVMLLSACSVADGETTAPTKAMRSHSLEHYTQWIGRSARDAMDALGDAQTVEFMGLSFSRSFLTEGELFSGVELTTQLNDADGQVASTVWDLVQGIDKEYITEEISHQNMHTDAERFASMEEKEYHKNMEKALEKRGAYIFDISWNLNRRDYMTDEIRALMDQLSARVLEETEQQFKDSTIDFIWSVNPRLDLLLEVTIWDANRADVKVTYRALAEPAGGLDLDLKKSDRGRKFFQVSYERLLIEENLYVLGYSFQTTEGNTATTWEEIYLHGDDFLYIVDVGHTKKIFLQVDGVQYKTVYRNGEYAPWEVLTEATAHPLPWRDTTMETAISNHGSCYGLSGYQYRNAFEARMELNYDGIKARFWSKANCIYKAEYRTTESPVIDGDYLITDYRRVLDIEIVTEQEAAAAIEEYKAMLP